MQTESARHSLLASAEAPTGLAPPTRAELQDWLVDAAAAVLVCPRDRIDVDAPILELGVDSAHLGALMAGLSERLGREIAPTFLIRHATIAAAAAALTTEPAAREAAPDSGADHRTAASLPPSGPIDIIGMACRFPRAPDLGAFWSNLVHGRDGLRPWRLRSGRDSAAVEVPDAGNLAGLVDGIDRFDADHFRIAPAEAAEMDPQQRLLLEVACEALEDAGLDRAALRGSETGVFVGASHSEFALERWRQRQTVSGLSGTGSALSIIANRLSYALDLSGPSLTVDTACSSSTVALHLACQSLRSGEIDTAIVAGVNLLLSDAVTEGLRAAGMLSPTSRCRSFDAHADGYVRGEGLGVMVLRRAASAPGVRSYAQVLATGCNQDGRAGALTAPNPAAQERLLRRVRALAGCRPDEVDFVEAHGSATPLGDPIEVNALAEVYGGARSPERPLWIGSVKSNIGHLEAAAGIAGLIKAALSLHHRCLPPSLHCCTLNPYVAWDRLPVRVADHLRALGEGRIIGGVSSFGFGGTNAHALLGSVPMRTAQTARRRGGEPSAQVGALVLVGARARGSLATSARRWADWLEEGPAPAPALLASASRARVAGLPWRAACWGRDTAEIVAALRALASTDLPIAPATPVDAGLLVLDGALPLDTTLRARLPWDEPLFRSALSRCREALIADGGPDLMAPASDPPWAARALRFAALWGLAELLQAGGLRIVGGWARGVGRLAGACAMRQLSMRAALDQVRSMPGAGPAELDDWRTLHARPLDNPSGDTAGAMRRPVVILSQDPAAAALVPGHAVVALLDDGRPLHVGLSCRLVALGWLPPSQGSYPASDSTWLPPTPWEHAVFPLDASAPAPVAAAVRGGASEAGRAAQALMASSAATPMAAEELPRTATEQVLAAFFADLSGRRSVAISTRLAQLVQPRQMSDVCQRLGERLCCEMGIDLLLRAPTLRELAAEIDGQGRAAASLRNSLQRGAARRRAT